MIYFSKFYSYFLLILQDTSTSEGSNYPGMPSSDSFLGKIIPNVWAFLVQLLALIVMIVIFFVFAYKPVKKIIAKRQDYIQEQIVEAQNNNNQAQETLKNAELNIIESRKKADEIIENAKKQTQIEQEKIIEQAKLDIIKMKDDAEKDIQRKQLKAKEEIKKEIVDVAFLATSELLKRETNSKDNELLIKQFIDEMEKDNGDN